jgi:D-alanine transaminase
MKRSLGALRISLSDREDFIDIAGKLIRYNHLGDRQALVYAQITRGTAPRDHPFPDPRTPPTVYVSASAFQPPYEGQRNGIKVILTPDLRWARCDIKSVALLPNVLAHQQARERGAQEAVLIRDGVITEGSRSNFCAVFDGQLVTHPKNNYILAGITREVVLELCLALNIPFRESPLCERDLREADELMILGTGDEVMPVIQVEDWMVGDGKPGPITRSLQRAFGEQVAALGEGRDT